VAARVAAIVPQAGGQFRRRYPEPAGAAPRGPPPCRNYWATTGSRVSRRVRAGTRQGVIPKNRWEELVADIAVPSRPDIRRS